MERAGPTQRLLNQATILDEYAEDPESFCRDFLVCNDPRGRPQPFLLWEAQRKTAQAVVKNRRVGRRSGHKVGKSKLAAGLAIWWVVTHGMARGVLTAPTGRQVKKALWFEIRRFWQESPKLRQLMPEPALEPETGIRWEDGRELFGFAASSADKVSGPGGPAVFVVVDEASGVPNEVWEALQGIRAGGGKVLALGNPTQTSGWFFDAFNGRREGWDLDKISSCDTPNYKEGREVIPGLADREFAQEIAQDHGGVGSAIYAVRVLGEFPKNVTNAVIGLGQIEAARLRWGDVEPTGVLDLGVDVARFGDDDSVVVGRRGLVAYSPAWIEEKHGFPAWANGYDSKEVAGLVLKVMRALRAPGERVRIKIDAAGGYGGAVADELRSQKSEAKGDVAAELEFVTIVEVQVAESSAEPENYPQLRDELWFNGRGWLNDGGTFSPDPRLESELVAPTYSMTRKGQMKVASKDVMKSLLPSGKSPDYADAFLLAIYDGAVGEIADVSWSDLPQLNRFETDSRGFG